VNNALTLLSRIDPRTHAERYAARLQEASWRVRFSEENRTPECADWREYTHRSIDREIADETHVMLREVLGILATFRCKA
jgi:hypothetical protein